MMYERRLPIVALPADEAAIALGVNRQWFDDNVANEVPHVRRGRVRLYSIKDLEKWTEANAERA